MWDVHVYNSVFLYYLWISEIGRGGYWFDNFPVVFGSTKIGIARNLEQCCSSLSIPLVSPKHLATGGHEMMLR